MRHSCSCVLLLAALAAPATGQRLIAVDVSRALVELNPATGQRTPIGTLSAAVGTPSGLAYDAASDVLYVASGNLDSLHRLNPTTAVATLIGSFGNAALVMTGIEFDSSTRTLYGMSAHDGGLYVIDKNTGAATLVGLTGLTNIWQLGYDSTTDVLYAANVNDRLYVIDRATGGTTLVGQIPGVANNAGIAFDPAQRRMFLIDSAGDTLFRLNTSSAGATLVGSTGVGNLQGLAFLPDRLIHDHGPVVTHPTGGAGGADASVLQVSLGMNVLGFGAGQATGNSLADDFALGVPTTIAEVELFAYQTGTTQVSTITGVFVEILNGDPSAGGLPVAGSPSLATNLKTVSSTSVFTSYRVTEATLLQTTRPIMATRVLLPTQVTLPAGIYWLRFQLTGSNTNFVFVPPITVLGQGVTGNAKQSVGATWSSVIDSGKAQGVPFRLYGGGIGGRIYDAGVPACGPATLTVEGAPVPGGFLRSRVSGHSGLAFIGYGFQRLSQSFCVCTRGHEWLVAEFTASTELTVPMSVSFCGLSLRVQGADLLGPGGCSSPMFALTRTVQVDIE